MDMVHLYAMGTKVTLQKKHVMVSPFLASLLLFKDSGDLCVECIDGDVIHINLPNGISKDDWQSYLLYIRTGSILTKLLDQGDNGILMFMGHDKIDAGLPMEYQRAVYRDTWAIHQDIDTFMCREHGTSISDICTTVIPSSVYRSWVWNYPPILGIQSHTNPIALLSSISLPHERVITNGKCIWMTYTAHYMYMNNIIYVDGQRLHEYDLPFLIAWHKVGHQLRMVNASIPEDIRSIAEDISDIYLVLDHDEAIYALCSI